MTIAAHQALVVVEGTVGQKSARVIDHPHAPVFGDHNIAEVAIEIVDQLVKYTDAVDLLVPGLAVGRHNLAQIALLLGHHDVVDPPSHRCRLPIDLALDGNRNHADVENSVEQVGGDVVLVAVREIEVGAGGRGVNGLAHVDGLHVRVMAERAVFERCSL
jgi:hypothetical protein